jgi:hypothetical protein
MPNTSYQNEVRTTSGAGDDWRRQYTPDRHARSPDTVIGLPLAGLVAVGIGALAWYYLGPDLRRYMKIRSM